jgi:hypothetical protein
VSGVVRDSHRGPVPGARVIAQTGGSGMGRQVRRALVPVEMDAQGRYRVVLRPGVYTLVGTADGYAPGFQTLQVLGDTRQDLRLDAEGRLAGTVVERASSAPVAGALVSATVVDGSLSLGSRSTTSGPDGAFELVGLHAGTYVVRGHLGRLAGEVRQPVGVGDERRNLRVLVDHGLRIAGRVSTSADDPVPGAIIGCYQGRGSQLRRNTASITTSAGVDGSFAIEGLRPGQYNLVVRMPGKAELQQTVPLIDRDVEDLSLVLVASSTIVGRTVDAGGAPVAGARVTAALEVGSGDAWRGSYRRAISDDAGNFRIEGVGDGRLSLRAEHERAGTATLAAESAPHPGGERQVVLTLTVDSEISGRVRRSDGRPAAGARVDIRFVDARPPWLNAETAADGEGRYAFYGVPPGSALLSASLRAGGSIRMRFREKARERGVQLQPGERKLNVDLDLPPTGTLAGRVLQPDGQPAAGATVIASVSEYQSRDGEERASTGTDGTFQLDEVDNLPHFLWIEHPDFAPSRMFNQMPGHEIVVRLSPGGSIRGTVVGQDGRPVHDFELDVGDQGTAGTFDSIRIPVHDPAGRFQVSRLKDGIYDLRAETPTGLIGRAKLSLAAARGGDVRIVVGPPSVAGAQK